MGHSSLTACCAEQPPHSGQLIKKTTQHFITFLHFKLTVARKNSCG